jgi:hypothetical protein
MAHLEVRNWKTYQHYGSDVTKGKRRLSWVKVYLDLLDDQEFGMLEDDTKWHVISCILLAGRLNNRLPADLAFLEQRMNVRGKVKWVSLIGDATSGWLVPVDITASELLQTPASTEEIRGEEIRGDISRRKRRGSDTSAITNGHPTTEALASNWCAQIRQAAIEMAMGDWSVGRWGKAGKAGYEREGTLDRIVSVIPLYNKRVEPAFRSPERFFQQLPDLLDFKYRPLTPEEMRMEMRS